MTAPLVDGTGSMAAWGPSLVVRPDRSAARGFLRLMVLATLFAVPSTLYLMTRNEGWERVWNAGFVVYWIWMVGHQSFVWGRLLAADALVDVSPWGIRVNDLGRGWVSLPWAAVGSVERDLWGRLVVKPAAGVGPSTPGTDWPPDRSTARRARRWGFKIPMRVASPDVRTVLAAVAHHRG